MKQLRKKLHSQNGASILLALLFLLVCMMAAASILMAAVSNAGKIRSNYEEQQQYLALSSAIRLVSSQLERAAYQGRYTVTQWTEVLTVTKEDGQETTTSTEYYRIEQTAGAFSCAALAELDADGKTADGAVLSFQKELDRVFAREFTGVGYDGLKDIETAPLPTNPPNTLPCDQPPTTRTLTVEVSGDDAVSEAFQTVTVEIDMNQSRRIHLTATLEDGANANGTPKYYSMEAELEAKLVKTKPDGTPDPEQPSPGSAPAIDYFPGTRLPKQEVPMPGPAYGGTLDVVTEEPLKCMTQDAIIWELDWISRGTHTEGNG